MSETSNDSHSSARPTLSSSSSDDAAGAASAAAAAAVVAPKPPPEADASQEEEDDDAVVSPTQHQDDDESMEEDDESGKDDSSFAASDEEEEDDEDSGSSDADEEEEEEEEDEKKPKKKKQAAAPAPAALPPKAKAAASTAAAASRRAPAAAASTAPPGLFKRAAKVTVTASAAIAAERDKGSGDDEGEGGGRGGGGCGGGGQDDDDASGEPPALSQRDAERRAANVAALLGGSLAVARRPIAQSLSVAGAEALLRSAFCSPVPGAPAASESLRRKLAKRRAFVPWGSSQPLPAFRSTAPPVVEAAAAEAPTVGDAGDVGPPPGEPLCLWEEPEEEAAKRAAAAQIESAPAKGGDDAAAALPSSSSSAPRARIMVDPMLTRWLRPHQREGVAFIFECVTGIKGFDGRGCLLADDMGLGKTLQALTLLWTMLNEGHPLLGGTPLARRAVICCPTSLVGNWEAEARKFLRGRLRVLALCECSRDDAAQSLSNFLSPRGEQVLIVSYETFRIHAPKFDKPGACDLLICDEAHRLKNADTLTSRAIGSLLCRARVLLSGTPLQNRLEEFHAMVAFANPGVLGPIADFRKRYEAPILAGREPGAAPEDAALGAERAAALSGVVNDFILRRTNALLSAHLPPKIVEVVCCRLTPLQRTLYDHFLGSVAGARALVREQGPDGGAGGSGKPGTARVLSAITSLRKLCNHPKLIWDAMVSKKAAGSASSSSGMPDAFAGCEQLFPAEFFGGGGAAGGSGRAGGGGGLARILGRGGAGGPPPGWEMLSGKFALAAALLAALHARGGGGVGGGANGEGKSHSGGFSAPASVGGGERIVIVSNATQTLDLFVALCRQRSYPFLRLDGSTSISKRTKLVAQFNDPTRREFVFLLSSKAGGCGLNLVGANRLVLFDPAWNPADDKQAAARVWRDGQKRRVFVYRLLATGTLDEKIWQRQCSKEGLKCVVDGAAGAGDALNNGGGGGAPSDNLPDDDGLAAPENAALMSIEELRDLFTLRADVASDTLEAIEASEGRGKGGGGAGDAADELARTAAAAAAAAPCAASSSDRPQDGKPAEEDIAKYARHSRIFDVDDDAMKEAAATCPGVISFVFSLKVDGKKLDGDGDEENGAGARVGGVAKAVPPASAPASAALAALPQSSSDVVVAPLQQQHQQRGSALGMRSRLGLGPGLKFGGGQGGSAAPRTASLAALTSAAAAGRPALGDATNIASRAFTAPARAGNPLLALPSAKRAKAETPLAAAGGRGRGGGGGGAARGRGRGRGASSSSASKPKGRGRKAASSDEEEDEMSDDESEEESQEEFDSGESEEEEEAEEEEEDEKEEAAEKEDATPAAAAAPSKTPQQPRALPAAASAAAMASKTPGAGPSAAAAVSVPAGGGGGGGGGPSRQSLSSVDPASGCEEKTRSASKKSRSPLYADDDDDFM